jgi:hypothetical protein
MMLVSPFAVGSAVVLFLTGHVLAAGSSNSSQNVVPNAAGDTALDQAKVDKYKNLLGK